MPLNMRWRFHSQLLRFLTGLVCLFLAGQAMAADSATGTIEGTVTSSGGGSPVAGARIFITGVAEEFNSDDQGRYSAEVPSGTYSLSVLSDGFNTLTQDGVVVATRETVALALELTPAGINVQDEVVVTGRVVFSGSQASVMAERRESEGVTDVLSMEQIARAGDADIAGALKRVTGLTLVDGQYVYVRGLGERYSSVLLNNAAIPSPDPTRRVVPLDLFPADVIEAVVVQKTASANLPGEFGGGTVQLRTVSFPSDRVANMSFSLGYRGDTTWKDGLNYEGSDTDWLGYDDGDRDMPASLAEATADGEYLRPRSFTNPDGYTPQEIEVFGEDVAAKSAYDVTEKNIPMDVGLSGAFGNSFDFGSDNRWGFLAAIKYDNKWQNLDETRKQFSAVSGGSGLELAGEQHLNRTLNYIDTSAFANLGVELGENHSLGFNAMLLRQAEDETKISEGVEDNQRLRRYELQWIENELLSYQATGSHTLPWEDLSIDWQYTDAKATREEPNTRTFRRDDDDEDGTYDVSTRADSNSQTWSDLEDNLTHWSVDTKLPLEFGAHSLAVSGGLGDLERDRAAAIRSFSFQGRVPPEVLTLPYSELYTPPFIGPSLLQLQETTRATDTYVASQALESLYLNLDLMLFEEEFRISAGLRSEDNRQQVVTSDLSNPDAPPVVGEIDQRDDLLSAAFTWAYSENAQVRAAYAESVNRPDFREMSPAPYLDPLLDLITVGNPDLITADLKNYDLRWEYYFSTTESLSIAGFYKEFANPIEKTFSSGGSGQIITLQNALAADMTGVEVDYSQTLGRINDVDWLGRLTNLDWSNFYIGFNYSWIDSSVEIDTSQTTQTNPNRPLQGLSPWVINLQMGYTDPDGLSEWTLLYNEFGKRIAQAGVLGQPDIYEQPFSQLDFVYKRNFADHWRVSLKLKNLLDPKVEFTQGQETTRVFKRGREIGLELEWDL